jgi:hypothetical protein
MEGEFMSLKQKEDEKGMKFRVIDVVFDPNYLKKSSKSNDGYDLAIAIIEPEGDYTIPPTVYNDCFSGFA